MLSSTSLFSSSGPVAPHAPLGPPWPLASPARLPRLPFLAPDRRLALDYVNLNALFIHLRINSHPSEPLRGSVTVADQSPVQGGKARLSLRLAGAHAAQPIPERSWRPVGAEARGGRGGRSWAERAVPAGPMVPEGGRARSSDPPSARGGPVGDARHWLEPPRGRRKCRASALPRPGGWAAGGRGPGGPRIPPGSVHWGPALPDVSCQEGPGGRL